MREPDDVPDSGRPAPAAPRTCAGPRDRRFYQLAVVLAVLAAAIRAWMAWRTHSTSEDFLITLRYAHNIATGRGFVYNPGQRVLGTTTPLYTLLLAAVAYARGDAAAIGIGKALNIASDAGTCYLIARVLACERIGMPVAGLFAAALYAFGSTPISVSIGGMESGLVTFTGLYMLDAYLCDQSLRVYVAGAILFLLRIDGLLLWLILALSMAWRRRRLPRREAAVAALTLLPWLAFATAYFGSPIPTSLVAKLSVYNRHVTPSWVNAPVFERQFLSGAVQIGLTILFALGVAITIARIDRARAEPASPGASPPESGAERRAGVAGASHALAGLAAPLLWLAIYYGVMLVSRVPAFGWYFLPPWPLYLIMAAVGAAGCAGALMRAAPVFRPVFAAAWPMALAAVIALGLAHGRSIQRDISRAQALEDTLRIPTALWLRANVPEGQTVMLEPIGYIGYYSGRRILDTTGLVSPQVIPAYRGSGALATIVRRFRPDWLVLRPAERVVLGREGLALPGAAYSYVRNFLSPRGGTGFLVYRREQDLQP